MEVGRIITYFMLFFSLIGAADRVLGCRFGPGRNFEKGFEASGALILAMIGPIALAPLIGSSLAPILSPTLGKLGIDPSVIAGLFLANDSGGWPLALALADDASRRDELRELGATEDEVAAVAASWHLVTTEVGEVALQSFDPAQRTREMLLTQKESRLSTYHRLLEFCEQPRSLTEISEFLKDDPGLEIDPKTGVIGMQPNAYIGKLDQAGALTWEGGWKTTAGGMEVLESIAV